MRAVTVPRQTFRTTAGRRRGAAGWEILLALVIVALAAGVALELWHRLQRQRRHDALVADLRTFAPVIERYVARSRSAGLEPEPPALPAALAHALEDTNWRRGSPFGGVYEWIPDRRSTPASAPRQPSAAPVPAARRPAGAIAITAFAPNFPLTASRADLLAVDAVLDDGNLATGRFRTGFNGWPIYFLAEK